MTTNDRSRRSSRTTSTVASRRSSRSTRPTRRSSATRSTSTSSRTRSGRTTPRSRGLSRRRRTSRTRASPSGSRASSVPASRASRRCSAWRSRTGSIAGEAGVLTASRKRTGDNKLQVLLKAITEKIPTHAVIFDVSTDRGIRAATRRSPRSCTGSSSQSLGYAKDLDLSELEIGLEERGAARALRASAITKSSARTGTRTRAWSRSR